MKLKTRWKRKMFQISSLLSHRAKAHFPPESSSPASTWKAEGAKTEFLGVETSGVHGPSIRERTLGLLKRFIRKADRVPLALLFISDNEIRRTARARFPLTKVIRNFAAQGLQEWALFRRGIDILRTNNQSAINAYLQLSAWDIQNINLRQEWAAWRVIPRSISGHLPNQPVKALDLC